VAWIAQPVPFHCSANGTRTPLLLWAEPTAVHDVGELHEVPAMLPCGAV
jgi:hypothetical protein